MRAASHLQINILHKSAWDFPLTLRIYEKLIGLLYTLQTTDQCDIWQAFIRA
jgi:hypothetical protein